MSNVQFAILEFFLTNPKLAPTIGLTDLTSMLQPARPVAYLSCGDMQSGRERFMQRRRDEMDRKINKLVSVRNLVSKLLSTARLAIKRSERCGASAENVNFF